MLHLPLYHAKIIGLLGYDADTANLFCLNTYRAPEVFGHRPDGCMMSFKKKGEPLNLVIYLSRWDKRPATIALLSHEALHAALDICENIGQPIDLRHHEYLTYLHQFIFQQLWEERTKGV